MGHFKGLLQRDPGIHLLLGDPSQFPCVRKELCVDLRPHVGLKERPDELPSAVVDDDQRKLDDLLKNQPAVVRALGLEIEDDEVVEGFQLVGEEGFAVFEDCLAAEGDFFEVFLGLG